MFRIAVWCKGATRDKDEWRFGRPTNGPIYEYETQQEAESNAAYWGDAYRFHGLVRVVEGDMLPTGKPD